ncbi:hypothetical protein [Rhizobium sp. MHM7A]|nr:hypothetical protein [Rhizobium sp. MHM7A]
MGKVQIDQEIDREVAIGAKTGNWRLVAAMLLSGLVAFVSGAYLLTA